jgi:hypothetical protein
MTTTELHAELKASLARRGIAPLDKKPYHRPRREVPRAEPSRGMMNSESVPARPKPCANCGKKFRSKREGKEALCGNCGGIGGSKLMRDPEVVAQMVALREQGWMIIRIAEHFGFGDTTVARWLGQYHDEQRQESRLSASESRS